MLTILRRELQNYFLTASGYIFAGVFLLVGGVFFFLNNILAASADLSATFSSMNYLFMIIMPVLTMRLFTEERRLKTDQLLFTAPVTLWQIVLGKFLAACVVLAITLAAMFPCVLILMRYAQPKALLLVSTFAGFFLLGCCYIAVGVLMSALTDNLVSAFMLTFGVNLLLQVVELIGPQLSIPNMAFVPKLFSWLSLYRRYDDFAAGVVSPANALYFASFMAIFLFITVRVLDARRTGGELAGRRKHLRRAALLFRICAVLAVVIALNAAAGVLETRLSLRADVTDTRVTQLDAYTVSTLENLEGEAAVYTLFQNGTTGATRVKAEEMLSRCAAICDGLHVGNIDPVTEPGRLAPYDLETIEEGAVLVVSGDGTRHRLILPAEYTYYASSPFDGETYEVFDLEARLTSALRFVTGEDAQRVLFLTGHNELSPEGYMTQLWQQLKNMNYDPQLLNLSTGEPAAGDTLLIVDPQRDLTEAQYETLRDWLAGGGSMLFCFGNTADVSRMPYFARLLDYYGMGFDEGMLRESEKETARWQDNPYYLVPVMDAEHAITAPLIEENAYLLFPQTRPLKPVKMPEPGCTYTDLLTTSPYAVTVVGDTDGAPAKHVVSMAMESPEGTRVVLISGLYALADTDFIYYSYNLEYTLGCIDWLSGAEDAPTIQAKMIPENVLAIPDSATAWTLGLLVAAALPALVLFAGIVVRIRRRRL